MPFFGMTGGSAIHPRMLLRDSVERGSRDVGGAGRGHGLLAELRGPAFCFLLVVAVRRRSQIVAQFGEYLLGLTFCEINLREHQACIGERVFTSAEHFDGFRIDAALGY